MKNIYITTNGKLKREENSLIFIKSDGSKVFIPIESVDSIYVFGEITVNTKLLNFLSQNSTSIFFFNHYGFFSGTYSPRQKRVSGKLLIKQVEAYKDSEKRLYLSKKFLEGAFHNMRKTLMQYELTHTRLFHHFERYKDKLQKQTSINNLMLIEANMRQDYYRFFNLILKNKEFEFIKRVKRPPDNFINTLISFGNSLLYNSILNELFKTQLNPTISYLHEPFERRYSLNLDLSEIFKPLIVDRIIFSLINKAIIKPEHFKKELNFCYLNDKGIKIFLEHFDKKINSSLKIQSLNKKVSYKFLLRLESYKLIKYLLEEKEYKPFKIYW